MNGFSIDNIMLYEQLGQNLIVKLSHCFYGKIYADTDAGFRAMFPPDMESAIRNQYEFFTDVAYFLINIDKEGKRIY